MFILVAVVLLMGCAKDITNAEAGATAYQYVMERIGQQPTGESFELHEPQFKNEKWYVYGNIEDDKLTVIMDKKGKVLEFVAYEWVDG